MPRIDPPLLLLCPVHLQLKQTTPAPMTASERVNFGKKRTARESFMLSYQVCVCSGTGVGGGSVSWFAACALCRQRPDVVSLPGQGAVWKAMPTQLAMHSSPSFAPLALLPCTLLRAAVGALAAEHRGA